MTLLYFGVLHGEFGGVTLDLFVENVVLLLDLFHLGVLDLSLHLQHLCTLLFQLEVLLLDLLLHTLDQQTPVLTLFAALCLGAENVAVLVLVFVEQFVSLLAVVLLQLGDLGLVDEVLLLQVVDLLLEGQVLVVETLLVRHNSLGHLFLDLVGHQLVP